MIQVFDKIHVTCETCGMKLFGENLHRIGDLFYCDSDYEKEKEKPENEIMQRDSEYIQELLGIDDTQLALNHDFTTGWTITNGTATSAKVWTSQASGKISRDFDLIFGKWYKLKVTASPSNGTILCYNSTDGTKLLGNNSFETEFVALTQYIEFRNSASTNTISLIELRKYD